MNNCDVIYLNRESFEELKERLYDIFPVFNRYEKYAFTIIINNKSAILVNADAKLSYDEMEIVIQHEKAHSKGIEDEEIADIWALGSLNENQKKILISNWKKRHGHEFTW